MPYSIRRRKELYENDANSARFVHYTSAEAALGIIGSKRVWMRNTTCMSDYREVHHGFNIYKNFFSAEDKRKEFCDALDACVPGAAAEALALFDQWWTAGPSGMALNTYIASLSEHDDKEDAHGRLSMWRAFGTSKVARVAIVLRIPWYTGGAQALNVMFSPVAYLNEAEVHASLYKIVENMFASGDFLRSRDRSHVVAMVFYMLLTSRASSTKGFMRNGNGGRSTTRPVCLRRICRLRPRLWEEFHRRFTSSRLTRRCAMNFAG